MSTKINSSIYHFENYIQIQKLNCVLKTRSHRTNHPGQKNQDNSYDQNITEH